MFVSYTVWLLSSLSLLQGAREGRHLSILYITLCTISHETPVVAMLSADHAVLVIGYTSEKYAYIDPADGERHSATPEEMAQMVSGSGNVFFGYVK